VRDSEFQRHVFAAVRVAHRRVASLNEQRLQVDRRAERRAARREQSRADILAAAERVFGEDGVRDGSLRKIAAESGFSSSAIYLFFENKQHLLSETLTRRGDELIEGMRVEADLDLAPLEKLHHMVDFTGAFFAERPYFRLLLRQIRAGESVTGPVLAEYASDVSGRFVEAMTILASIVQEGQDAGEIREGNPGALAHMYAVLLNEYVLVAAESVDTNVEALTPGQFHALVDGALRRPPSA
jgi:AcrR family transcriptional regulator